MRCWTLARLAILLAAMLTTMCGTPAVLAPPSAYPSAADASRAYEEAIAKDPGNANAHLWLGMLFLQEGRAEEAVERLTRATEIDPSKTEAFAALGSRLEAEGKFPEALRLYDAAIQGNTAFRQVVERRSELGQRRAAALASLDAAWALLSQGKSEDAAVILRPLARELPDEPRVHELTARAAMTSAEALLAYEERKAALAEAQTAAKEATRLGSKNIGDTATRIDGLQRQDEEQVAQAREKVEEGGPTFVRDVCLMQKAPLLTIVNRRGYDLTLDLRFSDGATQWVVVNDKVALRSAPDRESERLGQLSRGTSVWVKREGPEDYVQVLSSMGEGWIASSMIERASFVSFTIRAGTTLSTVLLPGTAQYRLGRGMRGLAEGTEEFVPYLCYSWE
ncbi:MAG: tetratricopeptide repeat protein [Candidatus Eisenbacteria bacterium]|nr:tetratricopeptide repeat protein [Candidatus Eisenbacteria bacterium]